MEFFNQLAKDSSLLLHAVDNPFNWLILKKTIPFSAFKNPFKKSAKQDNSSLFMNSILYVKRKNGRKPAKTRV
jgi:hypothetical protein